MSDRVVGIDASKKVWVAVILDSAGRFDGALTRPTIGALADAAGDVAVAGVDMPIGLADNGSRLAEVEARKLLVGRASTVFPSPTRAAIEAADYEAASAIERSLSGKGLTQQTYALRAKLLQVDSWVRGGPHTRVVEVHPEVSFSAMNGLRPLRASKHSWAGQTERRALLEAEGVYLPSDLGDAGLCAVDDVLDAAAAAWTAFRVRTGVARRLPEPPEVFADGLASAIHF